MSCFVLYLISTLHLTHLMDLMLMCKQFKWKWVMLISSFSILHYINIINFSISYITRQLRLFQKLIFMWKKFWYEVRNFSTLWCCRIPNLTRLSIKVIFLMKSGSYLCLWLKLVIYYFSFVLFTIRSFASSLFCFFLLHSRTEKMYCLTKPVPSNITV